MNTGSLNEFPFFANGLRNIKKKGLNKHKTWMNEFRGSKVLFAANGLRDMTRKKM